MHKKIRPREILRQRQRRLVSLAATLTVVAITALLFWWLDQRDWVGTDDAFVAGHLITVKNQSEGTVVEVLAENTSKVHKGDILVRLDGAQALIALQQAQAELAEAVRNVMALKAQLAALTHRADAKQAALQRVRHDLARLSIAVADGAAAEQDVQNAEDNIEELIAGLRETEAERQGLLAQLGRSEPGEHPAVERAKSRLRRAFLDYSRQNVIAPVSGYVAKRKVHVGDRLNPGTPLLVIVPLDQVWVEANFLETQAAPIRVGQPAEIRIDAQQAQRVYRGRVQGINPATGSTFALLPADNATGNFIHVAERLQVRIALNADDLRAQPLQPGLSTVTRVYVGSDSITPVANAIDLNHEAYRTDVFERELEAAEQLIRQVIAENAG
ncbi:efflux RND transporter periplasmic adaptor subunit [Methylomonas rhizoryzae]|uniref:efflux RND transporter periplasmic adaptor subunit n=1 Tax=Methylomonas rhizoryzae TaxID=2608981 RepID=UPI001232D28A|nr:efflux RND transporter periplasmic adaptor subunit [Methylomonas rhizoryzae]